MLNFIKKTSANVFTLLSKVWFTRVYTWYVGSGLNHKGDRGRTIIWKWPYYIRRLRLVSEQQQ